MPAAMLNGVLRCLIVDDSASFLEAAAMLLDRQAVTVAGVASTVEAGLRQARELQPDVILIDISLGAESGLELARRLAGDGCDATVILISTQAEADVADLIAGTEAAGFLPKSELSAGAILRLLSGPRGR